MPACKQYAFDPPLLYACAHHLPRCLSSLPLPWLAARPHATTHGAFDSGCCCPRDCVCACADEQDLRKKLLAAMRRAEAADATLIKMEGEREETRAVENAFKMKMKTLYEKRVRELESMQQDFEQVLSGPFLLPCLICWWRQRGFWKPFGTTVFVG